MKYNFDESFNRARTNSIKWEESSSDSIAMTIADMDFRLAPEITKALIKSAESGESGYVAMEDSDYQAVIDWCERRFGYKIPREHLLATPGVLYTTRSAMYALTKEGDKVIVQPPLHTPSIASAGMLGRVPLHNGFIERNGEFTFDLDNLKDCFEQGARVLMMCAPNNPTGRVWRQEELERVANLVKQYDAYVISDEIHRDIVWGDNRHIGIAEIDGMADRCVTAFSTSKTFNMGGFQIGSAVIANPEIYAKVKNYMYAFGHSCGRPSIPCITAQTTAYTQCEEWYQELLKYVEGNFSLCEQYLADTPLVYKHPEGTFLLWIDIRSLGWDTERLQEFSDKVKVTFDPGHYYYTADYMNYHGAEPYLRLNVAMPRARLEEALKRIRGYFRG